MTISNFDAGNFPDGGLTFAGSMCAPGVTCGGTATPSGNHFGGKLTGQLPATLNLPPGESDLEGFALGSFVRGPSNFNNSGQAISGSFPQGVIGNFAVGNDRYMASGIFGGGLTPNLVVGGN